MVFRLRTCSGSARNSMHATGKAASLGSQAGRGSAEDSPGGTWNEKASGIDGIPTAQKYRGGHFGPSLRLQLCQERHVSRRAGVGGTRAVVPPGDPPLRRRWRGWQWRDRAWHRRRRLWRYHGRRRALWCWWTRWSRRPSRVPVQACHRRGVAQAAGLHVFDGVEPALRWRPCVKDTGRTLRHVSARLGPVLLARAATLLFGGDLRRCRPPKPRDQRAPVGLRVVAAGPVGTRWRR